MKYADNWFKRGEDSHAEPCLSLLQAVDYSLPSQEACRCPSNVRPVLSQVQPQVRNPRWAECRTCPHLLVELKQRRRQPTTQRLKFPWKPPPLAPKPLRRSVMRRLRPCL